MCSFAAVRHLTLFVQSLAATLSDDDDDDDVDVDANVRMVNDGMNVDRRSSDATASMGDWFCFVLFCFVLFFGRVVLLFLCRIILLLLIIIKSRLLWFLFPCACVFLKNLILLLFS